MCKQTKIKPLLEKTYKLEITNSERIELQELLQQKFSTVCFNEIGDSPYKTFVENLLKKIKKL